MLRTAEPQALLGKGTSTLLLNYLPNIPVSYLDLNILHMSLWEHEVGSRYPLRLLLLAWLGTGYWQGVSLFLDPEQAA